MPAVKPGIFDPWRSEKAAPAEREASPPRGPIINDAEPNEPDPDSVSLRGRTAGITLWAIDWPRDDAERIRDAKLRLTAALIELRKYPIPMAGREIHDNDYAAMSRFLRQGERMYQAFSIYLSQHGIKPYVE